MKLDFLHDYALLILTFIITTLRFVIIWLLSVQFRQLNILSIRVLELIWTLVPGLILITLGLLSLRILYSEDNSGTLTVKVTGHQWYWSYNYRDFSDSSFDSFMKPIDSLEIGDIRFYEVDRSLVLPFNSTIQFLVNREDVIHSWTLLQSGIKVDANPGNLSLLVTKFDFPGLFYGQCRELCGVGHSFIPISVEVTSPIRFKSIII